MSSMSCSLSQIVLRWLAAALCTSSEASMPILPEELARLDPFRLGRAAVGGRLALGLHLIEPRDVLQVAAQHRAEAARVAALQHHCYLRPLGADVRR